MPEYQESLRLVIQRINSVHGTGYRVVVYGGQRIVSHSDFDNAAALRRALDTAAPGRFRPDLSADESGGAEHRIIFAETLKFSDGQLAALGLN